MSGKVCGKEMQGLVIRIKNLIKIEGKSDLSVKLMTFFNPGLWY